MTAPRFIALLFGFSLTTASASAQERHEHREAGGDPHGQVHFPITCDGDVQTTFDQAVAHLHSFGYAEARHGFQAVAERDPACGMAWWGVAMTYFHQYWDQPTPHELLAGREAAQQGSRLGAGSERERAYISAIGAFYRDADKLDHLTRARAYREAMRKLAADHPEDAEASVFYALSLLATRRPDDTTYSSQKEAAEILTDRLSEHPEHPGIVHYIIHAFDYPELAELALPAARTYAKLAPASPHALHMPSHIFTRVGQWDESIASNREVARVASERVARTHPGGVAFENLHANDYLAYAYLQQGDDERARMVLQEVAGAKRFDEPNFAVAYALVSVPARYAVERGDWAAAAALRAPEVDLPWENYPYARGNLHYAKAIGAARMGDPAGARRAVTELQELQTALAQAPPRGSYDWAGRVEAMRLAAAGWLAYAEGRKDEAVRLLTEASELEEKVGKHAVTPGPILPAREMLGDLLLELGRPAEALAAYEATLSDSPRRFNAVAGAAKASEGTGDAERAAKYYTELLELCRLPGCQRPAAQRAGAYLGGRKIERAGG